VKLTVHGVEAATPQQAIDKERGADLDADEWGVASICCSV
jgi:hypothetical protein